MRKFSCRLYGQRLRVTRLVLGITEQEAADACGVMLKTYRGYEEGKPQRGYRVPNAFYVKQGVSLNWLLKGEADHIGNHLAKGAKGKVAILPVVGHRRRKETRFQKPEQPRCGIHPSKYGSGEGLASEWRDW